MATARKLRADMSLPEVLLWEQLRKSRLSGFRFRRQHAVDPYVLDFYCPEARLAIEVDGAHHYVESGLARDRVRDVWLNEKGIRVLHIPASDILDRRQFDGVLVEISEAAESSARLARQGQTPPPALRATSPVNGGGLAPPLEILPCEAGEVARRAGGGDRDDIFDGED